MRGKTHCAPFPLFFSEHNACSRLKNSSLSGSEVHKGLFEFDLILVNIIHFALIVEVI